MLKSAKSFISKIRNSSFAKDSFWILLSRGTRLSVQAIYFIIIARTLGLKEYGAFVSVVALVNIITPFASWGSELILLKNVSRDQTLFTKYWGNSLLITFISGSSLISLILINYSKFFPSNIPFLVVLCVSISDLLFYTTLKTSIKAFQAIGNLKVSAQLDVLHSTTRLLAALCLLVFFSREGIVTWAVLYTIATIISASIGLILILHQKGKPQLALSLIKTELTQGFYFSVSISSRSIYANIDKTMLARLSTLGAAGVYASAYRLIDVAFVPIESLLFASDPKFFKQGAKGISSSLKLAKKLVPIGIAYSLIVAICVLIFAPIVPYILGNEYIETVKVLRWLALLPLLKCLHALGGNTLTGADLQGVRTTIQASIALFNFLLNLWLIPLYSWKGAIWSTLASDSLLALGCWSIVAWYYFRRDLGGKTL